MWPYCSHTLALTLTLTHTSARSFTLLHAMRRKRPQLLNSCSFLFLGTGDWPVAQPPNWMTSWFSVWVSLPLDDCCIMHAHKLHLPGCSFNIMPRIQAYSTWYSQAVSHPCTNQGRHCLASKIGRDWAWTVWYGCKTLMHTSTHANTSTR